MTAWIHQALPWLLALVQQIRLQAGRSLAETPSGLPRIGGDVETGNQGPRGVESNPRTGAPKAAKGLKQGLRPRAATGSHRQLPSPVCRLIRLGAAPATPHYSGIEFAAAASVQPDALGSR